MKKYVILFCLIMLVSCQPTINTNNTGEDKTTINKQTESVSNDNIIIESDIVPEHEISNSISININQVGYLVDDTKIAVFRGENISKDFSVYKYDDDELVYTGHIENPIYNASAEEYNSYGDFSEIKEVGTYVIKTESSTSYPFEIRDNLYNDLLVDVSRMYYLQRCGITLEAEYADEFSHGVCHHQEGKLYGTEDTIDISGGWHDAGDYGRYAVPATKAIIDLILAYEENQELHELDLNIPKSNVDIPDLLAEIKYELDWLLKMQASNGGVYHKVTGQNFPGTTMPDIDSSIMIVSPISDAATADFSAVMARSARLFNTLDPDYADICLKASISAFDYIQSQESLKPFVNPSDIYTGEYGDSNIKDEVFWASVELYIITNESKYHDSIAKYYDGNNLSLGWANVSGYGTYSYLRLDYSLKNSELSTRMQNDFTDKANSIVSISENNGYFVAMEDHYPWGSNMTIANSGMFLIMAHNLDENEIYTSYAKHHLNYLLGTNPMAISYVTGYGSYSPTATHHRPSQFMRTTMPGMLVGGPNSDLQDPYAAETLRNVPPAKCYLDVEQSYSTNEVTIYWNSPLVYLLSYF